MSKKNDQAKRKRAHLIELQKEKEAQEKRAQKAARRHVAEQRKELEVQLEGAALLGGKQKDKAATAKAAGVRKVKHRPARLKKGKVVKGIKVQDAESKQRIRKRLAAEAARRMLTD